VRASVLALAAPALAGPAYLPPFRGRAPALGDRWVPLAEHLLGNHAGTVPIEAVEVEETAAGWRDRVDDRSDLGPEVAGATAAPVRRNEWFLDADGSIRRSDAWVHGALVSGLKKTIAVFHGRRFGHLGWPRASKWRARRSG
jgi:hypothetical protein